MNDLLPLRRGVVVCKSELERHAELADTVVPTNADKVFAGKRREGRATQSLQCSVNRLQKVAHSKILFRRWRLKRAVENTVVGNSNGQQRDSLLTSARVVGISNLLDLY